MQKLKYNMQTDLLKIEFENSSNKESLFVLETCKCGLTKKKNKRRQQ